ncbi:MAG TPA: helix-turn-helix domain-containing protein [Pseudonocardiaceae bacterium]|nr:helix-turn-helix domain-containing protein [Pseudonocardiaceae bacterium]
MTHAELQNFVEDLAVRLDAPTVLEDAEQRMIAYSTHSEPIDDIRRDSILRKETKPDTKAWFRQFGIVQATEPVRTPGDPGTGVLGRLCVPVRYLSRLMGFLWLIDDEVKLGAPEISIVQDVAGHVGLMLYEEELTRHLTGEVVTQLLSTSAELRELSVRQIAESAKLDVHAPCAVVVLRPLGLPDHEIRPTVTETLTEVTRRCQTIRHLHAATDDHGVLLVQLRTLEDESPAYHLAEEARDCLLRRHRRSPGCRVIASVGEPQEHLIAAASSYQQARLSAQVAQHVPTIGDLPRWRDLGVFRVLSQLPADIAAAVLDPRLATVLRSGDEPVVLTLETYLDLGCDAKATAERLHLHRGTLYYRLQKAERIGGVDLRDGADRLSVHVGLKLARYLGLLTTTPPPAPEHSVPRS